MKTSWFPDTINAKKFPLQHVLWLGVLLILSPFASGLFLTVTFKTKLVPDTINAKKFLCTGKTQHVVRIGVLILSPFATCLSTRARVVRAEFEIMDPASDSDTSDEARLQQGPQPSSGYGALQRH